jgi:hypothetical protein
MLSDALPYDRLRERVEEMMEAAEPFEDVERAIEDTALREDQKAALWLIAWSLNDRSEPWLPPRPKRSLRIVGSGSPS